MTNTIINDTEILAAVRNEPLLADSSPDQQQAFVKLVGLLVEGQSRLNLTAIRDPLDMVRYHLADSLALARAAKENSLEVAVKNAADIGTGAGFPLIPMAIVWPETRWVGIESVQKKAAFVTETARALSIQNIEVVAERAENVARSDARETFDLVTSRAVGPVASLLEVGLPLLRLGGHLYLFKTEAAIGEWRACEEISKKLGFVSVREFQYRLTGDEQSRMIFIAKKTEPTPVEYPRAAGVPFRRPLVKADKVL